MKNSIRPLLVGSFLALGGALQGANAATTDILFDYNGTGADGLISVRTFDWSPDNALAVGATPLSTDPSNPTPFTLYAQGSLANFIDGSNQIITGTGLNSSFEITFEAGFSELGTNFILPGVAAFASFEVDASGPINFFNIYWDPTPDTNQAAGTGYGAGGDSILIMTAFALSGSSVFQVPFIDDGTTPEIVDLDGNGTNDAPGVGTVAGGGGGDFEAQVDDSSVNTDFFKSMFDVLLVDLFFNTSLITPFLQADPADMVVGFIPRYGAGDGVIYNFINGLGPSGAVDCTNGLCDFQFQADANQSFAVAAVPEPSTLALLGAALGGVGLFGVGRRREAL